MKKRLFVCVILALLLGGCGADRAEGNVTTNEVEQKVEQESETEQEEKEVYVLEFANAVTTEGEILSSDILGNSKLTMINVWATFCGPCINEMPDLGEIAKVYDTTEFQMLGIVSDVVEGDADMLTEAKELIEETAADYTHLLLNEELYVNLVGASDSVPTTYFVNQKGELLGYLVGAQSKEVWEEIIDGLLAEME